MANRLCFLVDGFNVYHSIVEANRAQRAQTMKWLDMAGLCRSLLSAFGRDAELARVFYFSAPADFSASKAARHAVYMTALRATGVEVQLGRFKQKDVTCPKCRSSFTRHEEKETDVALAVKLMELFAVNACDTIALVTGDTDLAPAIRTARHLFPDKRIWSVFPYGRHNAELKAIVHGAINLKAKRYAANQLPNPVPTSDGAVIWKPQGW